VISGMPAPGMVLWPPDNKLKTVATATAVDAGIGMASLNVTAASSDPQDAKVPDIVITDVGSGVEYAYTVELRAFRDAKSKDRIYTITATATDIVGNKTIATATVTVPLTKK